MRITVDSRSVYLHTHNRSHPRSLSRLSRVRVCVAVANTVRASQKLTMRAQVMRLWLLLVALPGAFVRAGDGWDCGGGSGRCTDDTGRLISFFNIGVSVCVALYGGVRPGSAVSTCRAD